MTTKLKEYIESGGSYQEGVSILERLNPLCVELKKLKAYQDKRFAPAAAQELLRKALLDCYQNASFASKSIENVSIPNLQPYNRKSGCRHQMCCFTFGHFGRIWENIGDFGGVKGL